MERVIALKRRDDSSVARMIEIAYGHRPIHYEPDHNAPIVEEIVEVLKQARISVDWAAGMIESEGASRDLRRSPA